MFDTITIILTDIESRYKPIRITPDLPFIYTRSFLISEPRLSGHGGVSDGVHSSGGSTTGVCCPICGMPLRSCDLEAHYTQELDYLAKLSAALIVSQQNQHNVRI